MSATALSWILIGLALVAANLPWISDRIFLVVTPRSGHKRAWIRWLELIVLYFLVGAVGFGMEKKLNGDISHQGWVFVVVTASLFLVFALPGFLWRIDLRHRFAREA